MTTKTDNVGRSA
ncbi:unnamed protein product, partial [Rotaria sp. Silwood2]